MRERKKPVSAAMVKTVLLFLAVLFSAFSLFTGCKSNDSSSPSPAQFSITVTDPGNDNLLWVEGNLTKAKPGDPIQVNYQCASGYTLTNIVVTPNGGSGFPASGTTDGFRTFNMPEANVTIKGVFYNPANPGVSYNLSAGMLTECTIEFNDSDGTAITGAVEDSPVTVVVTPSAGYALGAFSVKLDSSGASVTATGTGNTRSFIMPGGDVTVTATCTFSGYKVYFETFTTDPATGDKKLIAPQTITATGDYKVTKPTDALIKTDCTNIGAHWYKTAAWDAATGLYDYSDEWDFANDTVSGDMTLYYGWDLGSTYEKYVYIDWLWERNSAAFGDGYPIGYVRNLSPGNYKLGVRYYTGDNKGPFGLAVFSGSIGGEGNWQGSTWVQTALPNAVEIVDSLLDNQSGSCLKAGQTSFTITTAGWYFVGVLNQSVSSGCGIIQEMWLTRDDQGDVNLLPHGDLIFKDSDDMATNFHRSLYGDQPINIYGSPQGWCASDGDNGPNYNGVNQFQYQTADSAGGGGPCAWSDVDWGWFNGYSGGLAGLQFPPRP